MNTEEPVINLEEMINAEVENRMAYHNKNIDDPFTVNGFKGTWAITDSNRIAEPLIGYLQLKFGQLRMRRIPLDDINAALNELWEGPGSLAHIFRAQAELHHSGKDVKFTATDMASIGVKKFDDDQPVADGKSEGMGQVPLMSF